jgi:short-subunit dehydrogenase
VSRGIGYTIAVELAKEGVDLMLVARNRDNLIDVVGAVQSTGRIAHALAADLNQHAEVVRLGEEALRIWPTIDILVNNAGTNILAPASAVLYLASPAAAMVTGDCIKVDGGWTAQ